MRAPFLAIGGNNMFKMLHDVNFTYDSSMPVYENRPPSWPYTLDYKIFHDCMIPPCPTKSYPGVWEVPMVMWTDLKVGLRGNEVFFRNVSMEMVIFFIEFPWEPLFFYGS